MSRPSLPERGHLPATASLAALLALAASMATAQEPKPEPRKAVGKADAPLLQRPEPGKPWQPIKKGEAVHSRDLLLALPGHTAALRTDSGVELKLWGNLPQLSSSPVLESAVVLHSNADFDLACTLERGRVVVTNAKTKGAAKVRVQWRDQSCELTLPAPGDSVGLELSSRWLGGVPFRREPREGEAPVVEVDLYALKGEVELKTAMQQFALRAPPGPAQFNWHSVRGAAAGPARRQEPPRWSPADAKDRGRAEAALLPLHQALANKSVGEALVALPGGLPKDDPKLAAMGRQIVCFGLGAADELSLLADALADPKQAEVRQAAIDALRHWIGRDVGQDQKLFNLLTDRKQYQAKHAEVIMQLLHSPFERDQVETYETLIDYLLHGQLPIRELAKWHLSRLVPEELRVPFDPAAAEQERQRAHGQWKKLVTDGKLPPQAKPDGK